MEKGNIQELIQMLELQQYEKLEQYLQKESNLPGKMINLSLSDTFRKAIYKAKNQANCFTLLKRWLAIPSCEATVNEPKLMLPFCAIQAISSIFINDINVREEIFSIYTICMSDDRWRMREGVAMGLQSIAEYDTKIILEYFKILEFQASFLQLRAMIATLAHTPILCDLNVVSYSLALSDMILSKMSIVEVIKENKEDFKILEKGMSYAISLFVCKDIEAGYNLLEKHALNKDKVIQRIIKNNCKKARLLKKYPKECENIMDILVNP